MIRAFPLSFGFKTQALLFGILPALLLSLGLGGFMTHQHLKDIEGHFHERGLAVARELAAESIFGLLTGDDRNLELIAREFLGRSEVMRVVIEDTTHRVLVDRSNSTPETEPADEEAPQTFQARVKGAQTAFALEDTAAEGDAIVPASTTPQFLGTVHITLRSHIVAEHKGHILSLSLILILSGLLMLGTLAHFIGKGLIHPLLHLSQAMEALTQGKLETRVPQVSSGELGILEAGFNQMASRVAMTQQELEQEIEKELSYSNQTLDALEERNIALSLARRQADEANQAKSEFLANMSHELKTPLSGILGFARQLLRTPLSAEQQDYLRTLIQSGENLQSIIKDILDLSRLERTGLILDPIAFDPRALIDDMISLFAHQAAERGIELIVLVYNDVPDRVVGDRLRIGQVLINLLGNALRFTHPAKGSPPGEVVLRLMLDEADTGDDVTGLRFSVKDTGIGLDPAEQERLFRPFSQADSSIERLYGGSGLGLSICKRLIEQMGGEIGVLSSKGLGAEFWFTLKLPIDPEDDQTLRDRLRGTKALVVDSHPLSRASLAGKLEYLGVDCTTTEPGRPVSPEGADILILSLSWDNAIALGLYDGIEHTLGLPLPSIVLLTTDHPDTIATFTALGADACLLRPLGFATLHRLFRELIAPKPIPEPPPMVIPEIHDLVGFRVLVADDNPINLKLAHVVLHALGAIPTMAHSGPEAIDLAARQDFDLILMDLHMPGMSGLEAASRIRAAEPEGRRLPIIALTADTNPKIHRRVIEAGMDAVLEKPLVERSLVDTLQWLKPPELAPHPPRPPRSNPPRREEPGVLPVRDKTQALLAAAGLEAQAEAMFQRLLAGLDDAREEIGQHATAHDWQGLAEAAHKHKGSAGVCGALALERVLADLEQCAQEGEEWRLPRLFRELDAELERLREWS